MIEQRGRLKLGKIVTRSAIRRHGFLVVVFMTAQTFGVKAEKSFGLLFEGGYGYVVRLMAFGTVLDFVTTF